MGNLSRFEDEAARMLRTISASTCIRFGTDAPFALGRVGFARIGFADIPAVGFIGHCRGEDIPAVVPIARQHMLREVAALGLEVAAVQMCVHFGAESRGRLFVDENTSSRSHGKRKRGKVVRFHLEIDAAHRAMFERELPKVYL